jgi:hypothetical protein
MVINTLFFGVPADAPSDDSGGSPSDDSISRLLYCKFNLCENSQIKQY